MGATEASSKDAKIRHRHKIARNILFSLLGLWAVVIIAIQIVATPAVLTGIVNRMAAKYVNGDVEFGKITASMFKSFPNLNVTIDRFSLTYPHSRYAAFDSLGAKGKLLGMGRGSDKDTLASFRRLSVSINYVSAIFGRIRIGNADLDKPRIFAHCYNSANCNWDILKKTPNATPKEKRNEIPNIAVGKASLTGRPLIVFTNQKDTIYGIMNLRKMLFRGRLIARNFKKDKINFDLDSMMIAGRLPADTVALFMDHFRIKEKLNKKLAFSAQAKTYLGLNGFGRLEIPIDLNGKVFFPKSRKNTIALEDFKAKIATIPITGKGEAVFYGDSTFIKANAGIKDCSVNDFLEFLAKGSHTAAKRLKTDALINFTAKCNGYYNSVRKTIPSLDAKLDIPKASLSCKGFTKAGTLRLAAGAKSDNKGRLYAEIEELMLQFNGIDLNVRADAKDLLGKDPEYGLEASASATLDSLVKMIDNGDGYHAHGKIDANIKGSIRQSQMDIFNCGKARLDGRISSDMLTFNSSVDTISAFIDKADIRLTSQGSGQNVGIAGKSSENLSLSATIDSLNLKYKTGTFFRGGKMAFSGTNPVSGKGLKGRTGSPVIGKFTADHIEMKGEDSLFVGAIKTNDTFTLSKENHEKYFIPVFSFSSENGRLFVRNGANRIGFRNAGISATAKMNSAINNQRRKHFLDSLHRVYPGVPRDSLFKTEMRKRIASRPIPDFLSEDDFRKQDIDIRLEESLAKYVREWSLEGKVDIRKGMLISPYFPLKNRLTDIRGEFNNDKITLKNFTFKPGESDVSAFGSLSGLKRALTGMGLLRLDLKIRSEKLNADELLGAYQAGSKYMASHPAALDENLSDEDYLKKVTQNVKADSTTAYSMVVVPANLIANVSLQCNEIDYSDLKISWLAADMAMKERCAQITNAIATSNMGDIYFEGFYSTKTKKDIRGGFDLNMTDITADKVIQLFPAVDTIMPMLKSFKGNLDCEMAATSDLDTNMNFITPSIKGVMQIGGKKLSLDESGGIRKISKALLFKNKDTGYIDDMSVNGLIDNNVLEIFPFILKVDRYTVAMSGKQNFDQSFRYHISVLKSPIPFRFGINLFGNFDNWKYRLCRAQYKNTNVPVFTAQLDTVRRNLIYSIHNIFARGVEFAMKDNASARQIIDNHKVSIGYNPEIQTDTLSAEEQHRMDSLSLAYEHPVDSTLNATIDKMAKTTPDQNSTENQAGDSGSELRSLSERQTAKKLIANNKKEERKEAAAERRLIAAEKKADRQKAKKDK